MTDVTHEYRLTVVPHAARLDGELVLPPGEHLIETVTWVPGAYAFLRYGRDLVDVRTDAGPARREGYVGHRVPVSPVRFSVTMADPAWAELAGYVSSDHAVIHATRLPHARALGGRVRVHWLLPEGWHLHHPEGAVHEGGTTYTYPSFAAWLDCPVVCGTFEQVSREEDGVVFHHVCLERAVGQSTELDAFVDDVQKLARAARDVFGSFPFQSYSFVWGFDSRAHWGLEHAHSTLVGVGPLALIDPEARFAALRVAAHELVHAWNVCRLKPAALARLDLVEGSYPGELWIAEGFTRYYEFLLLVRAGLCTPERFFANVANYHRATSARPAYARVSPLDSSRATFLNHTRYPNAANASLDYYDAGMLIAFDLDAHLRRQNDSLDAAFRTLWERFGSAPQGYTHDDACNLFAERGAGELVRRETETAGALSTLEQLRAVGFTCTLHEVSVLGFVLDGDRVVHVTEGGPAEAAGIHPDDRLVTHDDLAFSATGLAWLTRSRAELGVVVKRGDRLVPRTVRPAKRTELASLVFDGTPAQAALLETWLGQRLEPGTTISLQPYDNFHGTERVV